MSHCLGVENGIADMAAPFASLIGVFLGPNQPDQNPAPGPLDFNIPADRDYLELPPAFKQPFFIVHCRWLDKFRGGLAGHRTNRGHPFVSWSYEESDNAGGGANFRPRQAGFSRCGMMN